MSLPIKFMIGLFLLMLLGSFLSSLYDPTGSCSGTDVSDVLQAGHDAVNSFDGLNIKSLVSVSYTSGVFVKTLLESMGAMVYWDFCWFNGFEWIQMFLVVINFVVMTYIIVDLARLLKPFGG